MDRLYSYLMNPTQTIQLYTHNKDWRLWWGLLVINAIISMVKLSSLTVVSLLSHITLGVGGLVILAIIIDATAQLMRNSTQLPSVLYWLGFAKTVLWLSPSLTIIQDATYSIGSIILFLLNIVFVYYLWTSIKKIYNASHVQVITFFIIPGVSIGILLVAFGIYVSQLMVMG